MKTRASKSRQNRSRKVLVLQESLVKRDNLKVGSLCKCRQIGIAPDVCRRQRALRQQSPVGLDALRFSREHYMDIGIQLVIKFPCVAHRNSVSREDLSVCRQPKKPLLSQSTETTTLFGSRMHPRLGSGMVRVRLESECEPKVNIRKMHLLRPSPLRSSRWSDEHCLVLTMEQEGIRLVFASRRPVSTATFPSSRSLSLLLATTRRCQTQSHRLGLVREYSYFNRTTVSRENQALIQVLGEQHEQS